MEPGVIVLMFPIFYLTSAYSVVALLAGIWIIAVEWRERHRLVQPVSGRRARALGSVDGRAANRSGPPGK